MSYVGKDTSLQLSGFSNPKLTDDDVVAMASSRRVAHLTSLSLSYFKLTDKTAIAIANSPHVQGLKALDLNFNPIGNERITALCAHPPPKLTALMLGELSESLETPVATPSREMLFVTRSSALWVVSSYENSRRVLSMITA